MIEADRLFVPAALPFGNADHASIVAAPSSDDADSGDESPGYCFSTSEQFVREKVRPAGASDCGFNLSLARERRTLRRNEREKLWQAKHDAPHIEAKKAPNCTPSATRPANSKTSRPTSAPTVRILSARAKPKKLSNVSLALDPFAGSCATGEAAERLRRKWIAFNSRGFPGWRTIPI